MFQTYFLSLYLKWNVNEFIRREDWHWPTVSSSFHPSLELRISTQEGGRIQLGSRSSYTTVSAYYYSGLLKHILYGRSVKLGIPQSDVLPFFFDSIRWAMIKRPTSLTSYWGHQSGSMNHIFARRLLFVIITVANSSLNSPRVNKYIFKKNLNS